MFGTNSVPKGFPLDMIKGWYQYQKFSYHYLKSYRIHGVYWHYPASITVLSAMKTLIENIMDVKTKNAVPHYSSFFLTYFQVNIKHVWGDWWNQ